MNYINLKNNVSRSADDAELSVILEQSELWVLPKGEADVIQNAIERLFYAESLRVGNAVLPQNRVRAGLRRLTGEIVQDACHKVKHNVDKRVKNSTAYLMSVLFNCIFESQSDLMADPYLNRLARREPLRALPFGGDTRC